MSFESFALHPDLLRGVADLEFTQPTPIQLDAIPPAMAGRDVLACAKTGSGKTAAFLLPILHNLLAQPRGTTRVLILSPTRELAAQTAEHLAALARHTPLTGAAVFGGVAMGPQENAFKQGVDVLVATPGRLLDHFQHDYAKLSGIQVLVLDEADRMLDMGFLPDIGRILRHLNWGAPGTPHRQALLFSATLPAPIVELSRDLLEDPAAINIDRDATPAEGITQAIYPVKEPLKRYLLVELLKRGEIANAIVFTRTKHRANRLADFLVKQGIVCDRIHGNRSQKQRTEALAGFKEGKFQVLVATDIAARGIDVEALSHVVNFDVPKVPGDYIHRVGRTARAEQTGDAFTFVGDEELPDLYAIERAIGRRLPQRQLAGFDYDAKPAERFEIPAQERIAEIRSRRAEERSRGQEKAERRAQAQGGQAAAAGAPAAGAPAASANPAPSGGREPSAPQRAPRERGTDSNQSTERGQGGNGYQHTQPMPAAAGPFERPPRAPRAPRPLADDIGNRLAPVRPIDLEDDLEPANVPDGAHLGSHLDPIYGSLHRPRAGSHGRRPPGGVRPAGPARPAARPQRGHSGGFAPQPAAPQATAQAPGQPGAGRGRRRRGRGKRRPGPRPGAGPQA